MTDPTTDAPTCGHRFVPAGRAIAHHACTLDLDHRGVHHDATSRTDWPNDLVAADAELRTSHPAPRPADDDPRVGVAANAIGWERRHRSRPVLDLGDGNAQITVTAAEAAEDMRAARRVVAQLAEWDTSQAQNATTERITELTASFGLEPEQEIRARALNAAARLPYAAPDAVRVLAVAAIFADWIQAGIRPESKPRPPVVVA
jgi:hypothetical protein